MHEEIGTTAGAIWQALNNNGELSLSSLKHQVAAKSPVFDWALGWLAREDKVVISRQHRGYRVRLNDWRARSACGASAKSPPPISVPNSRVAEQLARPGNS